LNASENGLFRVCVVLCSRRGWPCVNVSELLFCRAHQVHGSQSERYVFARQPDHRMQHTTRIFFDGRNAGLLHTFRHGRCWDRHNSTAVWEAIISDNPTKPDTRKGEGSADHSGLWPWSSLESTSSPIDGLGKRIAEWLDKYRGQRSYRPLSRTSKHQ
jgi:hypothetical protein